MKTPMTMGILNSMAAIAVIASISNTMDISIEAFLPSSHYPRPAALGKLTGSRGVETRICMFDWVNDLFGGDAKKKEEEAAAAAKAKAKEEAEAKKKAEEEAKAAAEQAAKERAEAEAIAKQKAQEDAAMLAKAKAEAEAKFAEFEAQQKAEQEAIASISARTKAKAEAKTAVESETEKVEDETTTKAEEETEIKDAAVETMKTEKKVVAKIKEEAEATVATEAQAEKVKDAANSTAEVEDVAAAQKDTEEKTTSETAENEDDGELARFNAYLDEVIKKGDRIKGVVQWYNPKKGFGFIKPFQTADEEFEISKAIRKERAVKEHEKKVVTYSPGIYVHHNSLYTPDETYFRKLYPRESVELEVDYDNEGRPTAKDVTGPDRTDIQAILKEKLRREAS